jgi:phosphoribosyl 1,2-cyclic phosphodiesterase
MLIRFWGTRGSIPTPGRQTAYFGGNTSCVEVRADDGEVLMLDCGTGARPLGLDILSRSPTLPPIHILVTHTHWDHIQGFPFFLPAYVPGSRLTVYGARGLDRTLESSLSGQMQHTYFPVELGDLRADIEFNEVSEQRFPVGQYRVTTQFLNHTAPTIGYRIERGDLRIVYVTDHEPFAWRPVRAGTRTSFEHPGDERHLAFIEGADLLIHDAQYVDREYPGKRGWGHSTVEYVTDLAVQARVKQLALFHHDPQHSDRWVRQQTERAQQRARQQGSSLRVLAAAEGVDVTLRDPRGGRGKESKGAFVTPTGRVMVTGSDGEGIKEVKDALAGDGYRLAGITAMSAAALGRSRPDLVILVGSETQAALLDHTRKLREQAWAAKLPVIVLPGAEGPGAAGELVDNSTEVLSRPFNPAMLRPRVRAWLTGSGHVVEPTAIPRRHRLRGADGLTGGGLLRGLPFTQRAALLTSALTCRFRPGEVLFRQGDAPGGVYFLRSGKVQISIPVGEGKEKVLGILKVGDTVGELAALDGGPRTATATALEPTTADYVAREPFQAGLSGAPDAAVRLLRLLARRLRETDRYVGELATARDGLAAAPARAER